jgi:hypothetical protein
VDGIARQIGYAAGSLDFAKTAQATVLILR